MYGKDTQIRLRPSFFPLLNQSAEMDVYWGLKIKTIIELQRNRMVGNFGMWYG